MKYVDFIENGVVAFRVPEEFADKLQGLYPEIFCEENFEICWADERLNGLIPTDIEEVYYLIDGLVDDLPAFEYFKNKWED